MLKKIIMGAAVVAVVALAAPDQSEARGGGWHGGGWHGGGWHGGGWHGGGWHAGKWNNGGKWRNGKWYGGYGGWGVPAAVAVGAGAAAAAAVAAPYYYNNGCYRNVQVMTAYGPQWRLANVC
jgi:hypothetical protein